MNHRHSVLILLILLSPVLTWGSDENRRCYEEAKQVSTPEECISFLQRYPRNSNNYKVKERLRDSVEVKKLNHILNNPADSIAITRFLREELYSKNRDTVAALYRSLLRVNQQTIPFLRKNRNYFITKLETNREYSYTNRFLNQTKTRRLADDKAYQLMKELGDSDSLWREQGDSLFFLMVNSNYIYKYLKNDTPFLQLKLQAVLDGYYRHMEFMYYQPWEKYSELSDEITAAARHLLLWKKNGRERTWKMLFLLGAPREDLYKLTYIDRLDYPELYPGTFEEALSDTNPSLYSCLYGDLSSHLPESTRRKMQERHDRYTFRTYLEKPDTTEILNRFWFSTSSDNMITDLLYQFRNREDYRRFALEIFEHPHAIRESMDLLDRRFESFPKREPGNIKTFHFDQEYLKRLADCHGWTNTTEGCYCSYYDYAEDYPFPTKKEFMRWVKRNFGEIPKIPKFEPEPQNQASDIEVLRRQREEIQ